ncbi:MAG: hypothetical protein JWR52_2080 [Marmoricola sp.]|nr:hypothetical protein [Marmoricola sp.]
MIGPLDEYPIHQAPLPINRSVHSDRNFYDRCYFNAMDTAGGETMLVTGIGYYPNLGVKDAYVLLRRGQTQTAVHLSDAIDQNRLDQRCGGYRLEVIEPLQKIRLVLDETEGMAMDLTWDGSYDVVQELPHLMLASETRPTLDAQRFAQLGSWSGSLLVDGEEITVSPDTWMGSRDRSWGIRPVGEAEPAGRPQDPPMEGFWWLYVPMRFESFSIVVIIQERHDGFRTLNDVTRVWKDGRVEQLGWPKIEIEYAPGTRTPTSARLSCTGSEGQPVVIEVETRTHVVLHVGGGYGGDPDWTHGQWKGENFVERVTYDLTDPGIVGRIPFGVIDHCARASCDGEVGHGLFEHGTFGRHDPSGFIDWSNDRS